MVELTLAGIAATVLTEGVTFLYGQASDLLSDWRARRKGVAQAKQPLPTITPPDGVFAGELKLTQPDPSMLERQEDALDDILVLPTLVRIANGRDADPSDPAVVEAAEVLRALLEDIYRSRITLVGESQRATSGTPLVRGKGEADTVAGLLQAVKAGTIGSGTVEGEVTVKDVQRGGRVVAVEADRIG